MGTSHEDPEFPDTGDRSGGGFFSRRAAPKSPNEALQPEAAPPLPALPPRKPRRSPLLSAISGALSLVLVLAVAIFLARIFAERYLRQPGPLPSDKVVLIAPQTDVPDIINQLEAENVIESPLLLNLALLEEGKRSRIKAGEYLFHQHASLREVIDTLVNGKEVLHALTIPEGLTSEQIVERLRDSDVLAGELRDIPKEGSLMPNTYKFARGTTRDQVIQMMQRDQKKVIEEIWSRRAQDIPFRTPFEMVTLASIVEKETGRADERTRVAGVFINRLTKRMKLQSDPTIVYGLVGGKGTLGRGIARNELEQVTPYNTYIVEGLPPGPICNPGRAAMEAVANPSRTKELYFVADGSGGHAFAETLDQHAKNVQRWRQIEKDSKDKAGPDADKMMVPVPGQKTETAPTGAPFGNLSTGFGAANPILAPTITSGATPLANPAGANAAGGRAAAASASRSGSAKPALPAGAAAPGAAAPAAAAAPAGAALTNAAVANTPAPGAAKNQSRAAALKPPDPATAKPAENETAQPAQASAARPSKLDAYTLGPSADELGLDIPGMPTTDNVNPNEADTADGGPSNGPIASYPVSPARRAEQKARAAQYGLNPGSDSLPPDATVPVSAAPVAVTAAVNGAGKRKNVDASEGTRIDPLLNHSYDLNTPKTVPVLP
jgi:UPF0755 protein